MGNIKQVAQTIEELGLLGDFGLPELDELLPPPADLLKKAGIPTPRDILMTVRQTLETLLPVPQTQPAPARQQPAQQAEVVWLPPPLPLLPPLPLPPLPRLRGPGGP